MKCPRCKGNHWSALFLSRNGSIVKRFVCLDCDHEWSTADTVGVCEIKDNDALRKTTQPFVLADLLSSLVLEMEHSISCRLYMKYIEEDPRSTREPECLCHRKALVDTAEAYEKERGK